MANEEQLVLLTQGSKGWNAWRQKNPSIMIDLSGADLSGADLGVADLQGAKLWNIHLQNAHLQSANLNGADLRNADLRNADLQNTSLNGAIFWNADLQNAHLQNAILSRADLWNANLSGADLAGTQLDGAHLLETNLTDANLTGCLIYGISAWNLTLEGAQQKDLIITPEEEPVITVDNLEVAQFLYLLLHNEKIRDVINTIGKKGVLILGRFTDRKPLLDSLREALRQRNYLPIVFDFERPTERDLTETVMTLAGMCLFIIADITKPKSVPLESQAIVPNYMIPFVPLIQAGEEPFAMFADLRNKYQWVLEPLEYDSVKTLVQAFDRGVIKRAQRLHDQLAKRKAQELVNISAKSFL